MRRELQMNRKMNFRTLSIQADAAGRPSSLDEKSRSVEVIGATEAPVDVFDFERFEIVPEVLLMSGCEMPKNRQVPLFDTHQRFDGTGSVLGSYREMLTDGDQLVGRVHFSSVATAEDPWIKLREGHLTDFSAGYRPVESTWVPDGEKAVIKGRSYEGPVKVTTRWRVKELSICPIGADDHAKARSENNNHPHNGEKGKKTMPVSDEERQEIQRIERERVTEIRAMCEHHNCEHLADGMISDESSLDVARAAVLNHLCENQPNIGYRPSYDHPATILDDETDKRTAAVIDGLALRAGVYLEKPAPGSREYRGVGLVDIARECLVAFGIRVAGMSKSRIVKEALSGRAMQSSDFPLLLANTAEKVLRMSYQQAPSTFEQWTKKGTASDFKTMTRPVLSAAPALDEIPENGPYKYGEFAEASESFAITKHGKLFAVTREAIVNDDLGALTSVPRAFAMAAKRKVNAMVYSVLTANAAMSDGVALFHAGHNNFVDNGAGAAPGETTLTAARLAMRRQTGLQGELLNIRPGFLITPAALETTGDVLLNSLGSLTDAKNEAVKNPFYRKLELVTEPLLDDDDAAAWYVSADPREFDTVEVAYLDGNESPYLETRNGWTVDGVEYKVRIECGAKALDWRGLYFNDGN